MPRTTGAGGAGRVALLILALASILACDGARTDPSGRHVGDTEAGPTIPAPRTDPLFQHRHESMRSLPDRERVRLVFLGDSILRHFETEGRAAWRDHYAPRRAANFAIEGDRTQNVLWRIEDGLFDGMAPRLIVLGIGTNNTHESSAAEIAAGVRAVVDALRARIPGARILVLALLPRGSWAPGDPVRVRVERTNALVAAWASKQSIDWLDVGPAFLAEDGLLDRRLMPDGLHPGAAGYAVLAESLEPELQRILGDGS